MTRLARLGTLAVTLMVAIMSGVDVIKAHEALPPDTAHYPDLLTRTPTAAEIVIRIENGRKLLRFSNTVYNWGDGPLELRPKQRTKNQTEAYQRIYAHASNGTAYLLYETLVGTFVFHRSHHHWHFDAFALYEILDNSGVRAESQKTTVCIRDNVNPEDGGQALPHFGWGENGRCDKNAIEGLSVGYGDTYPWNIDGQSLDITDLADGCYVFRSTANPNQNIIESNYDNNSTAVRFFLSGTTLTLDHASCGG